MEELISDLIDNEERVETMISMLDADHPQAVTFDYEFDPVTSPKCGGMTEVATVKTGALAGCAGGDTGGDMAIATESAHLAAATEDEMQCYHRDSVIQSDTEHGGASFSDTGHGGADPLPDHDKIEVNFNEEEQHRYKLCADKKTMTFMDLINIWNSKFGLNCSDTARKYKFSICTVDQIWKSRRHEVVTQYLSTEEPTSLSIFNKWSEDDFMKAMSLNKETRKRTLNKMFSDNRTYICKTAKVKQTTKEGMTEIAVVDTGPFAECIGGVTSDDTAIATESIPLAVAGEDSVLLAAAAEDSVLLAATAEDSVPLAVAAEDGMQCGQLYIVSVRQDAEARPEYRHRGNQLKFEDIINIWNLRSQRLRSIDISKQLNLPYQSVNSVVKGQNHSSITKYLGFGRQISMDMFSHWSKQDFELIMTRNAKGREEHIRKLFENLKFGSSLLDAGHKIKAEPATTVVERPAKMAKHTTLARQERLADADED